MILFIDNYDSFTYNLVQYFGKFVSDIQVYRNDQITIEQIEELNPQLIVISPGPCTPKEAGISIEVIKNFHSKKPILGVCLGHQSIGYVFGGNIINAKTLMHGKTSQISHIGNELFENISSPFTAIRYHSLVIEEQSMPQCLEIIARSEDNEIMAVKHREFPVYGVQFHPESILTKAGETIVMNFLKIGGLL
ncbi:MAG: anthranilate/aminodeoxychorismate synthase component II [Candidatus Margulisiibacteriota bacterium]|nr:MAG: anthranilate/aminodeoxychorismate synthase component II [Candidatus Margulisbacteria bacterium GWD2_39_127]OGI03782.1 MAG: anthranilate/aminodeoxychorismate synthase component II [Candidatus Margulisbacteria bacterium GWF2_38_17]OGI05838.1 MAG: anthranilate/aminodeoxychorismate synthase component II [Candidatus Margulisbacteria bacterium GWE2_39_32]PZM82324.1 MAG: anthranilate/aminodeoxychorismate synthase component II [Candidatus Margulisiibacteriota bacterium]HAR64114.1 anthranilate/a